MNPTEHNAKKPPLPTGLLALLRAFRHLPGSRAPSARPCLTVTALPVALALALLVPSFASAHFVRPLLRQIAGTCQTGGLPPKCAGKGVGFTHFAGPEGITVDGQDDLWVGEGDALDEFEPSGAYVKSLQLSAGEPAEHLAIDDSSATDTFYIGSGEVSDKNVEIFDESGAFVSGLDPLMAGGASSVAVDNSSGPSAHSVYVINRTKELVEGRARAFVLEKLDAAGEEEDFSGSATYISKNEITGYKEEGGCKPSCEFHGLTVDPANGDIYVGREGYVNEAGEEEPQAVLEFSPAGLFLRAFSGKGAPSPFPNNSFAAGSLAVDPTDGDLLVALGAENAKGEVVGAVDEFDSNGAFLGQITEAAGVPLSGSLGLAADSHGDVYVVNNFTNGAASSLAVDEFAEGRFDPGLRLAAASQTTQSSAVLNGSVDPESELDPEHEAGITDCRFEYVTEAAFQTTGFEDLSSGGEVACEHPDSGEIPKTDAYTPVHAEVSEHVVSGVTYRYRLSATVGGALGGTGYSEALAFTAPHAPVLGATAVNEVTSTFAAFSGDVDPLGADTTYRFEYLPVARFDANGGTFAGATRTPEVDIGSGGEAGDLSEAVFQQVSGLAPETTYRFRLVASNVAGVSEGERAEGGGEVVHVFTTQAAVSPVLPDGRAYELLTPTDKDGAQDMFGELFNGHIFERGVASQSGDQFLLSTPAAFGPFAAAALNTYVFSRHPAAGDPEREEWSFASLVSPALGIQTLGLDYESRGGVIDPSDFSRVAFNDQVGQPSSERGYSLTDLQGPPGGPYTTLHADQPNHDVGAGQGLDSPQETTQVVGGSDDLGVVVLRSNNPLLAKGERCEGQPEGVSCSPPIYHLYESAGGGLAQLDVGNGGKPVSACGAVLGAGDAIGDSGAADGAVSGDGSKVFFTAPIPLTAAHSEGLEGMAGCPTPSGAKLENPAQLYLRSGEETIELSRPEKGAPEGGKGAYEAHYVRADEDGSRVFFTSEGELTASDAGIHDDELYEWRSEGTGDCASSEGCLTRVSAGQSGHAEGGVIDEPQEATGLSGAITVSLDGSHVYFVAQGVLAPANAQGKTPTAGQDNLYVYDTRTGRTAYIAPAFRYAFAGGSKVSSESGEATGDGRFLLFRSALELTPGAGTGQLYRYEAESEGVLCVSCAPGGRSAPGFQPPETTESPQNLPAHSISEDDSYVFFDTAASLVPQDTNGVLDVYEWHEGRISLISSGQSSQNSYLMGASPNGANVFFGTHARLVPADTDSTGNLYDARICTASEPCIQPPPQREGLCEADGCSHPPPAPLDQTPASLTFSGAGNLTSQLVPPPAKETAAQRRAKKLAAAIKVCKKDRKKTKRVACEKHARKKYGPVKAAKKSARASNNRRAGR